MYKLSSLTQPVPGDLWGAGFVESCPASGALHSGGAGDNEASVGVGEKYTTAPLLVMRGSSCLGVVSSASDRHYNVRVLCSVVLNFRTSEGPVYHVRFASWTSVNSGADYVPEAYFPGQGTWTYRQVGARRLARFGCVVDVRVGYPYAWPVVLCWVDGEQNRAGHVHCAVAVVSTSDDVTSVVGVVARIRTGQKLALLHLYVYACAGRHRRRRGGWFFRAFLV